MLMMTDSWCYRHAGRRCNVRDSMSAAVHRGLTVYNVAWCSTVNC